MRTITRLARSNNKKNKTRSILIMATIFLTTILLTVICTFGWWMLKYGKANAALINGSHYGIFVKTDSRQLQEMQRRGEFSRIGLMANAGLVKMDGSVNFLAADDTIRDLYNIDAYFTDGIYPQRIDEIAAQKEFFAALGYPDAAVGDKIALNYRSNLQQTYELREFTVSGIMQSLKNVTDQRSFSVYVSQAFLDAQYQKEDLTCIAAFRLGEEVTINADNAEEVLKELAAKCGIEEKYVSVNWGYLAYTLEAGFETLSVCAVIAVIVILFSVMIIYNIYQVGIVQNIREYGKIRALGASKKQMRSLIFQEGLSLAGYSIPSGVAAGYLLSWAGIAWLTMQEKVVSELERIPVSSFSPAMLLLSAVLALLTVLLALRRPMKIVSKISPAEAVRYMENTGSSRAGFRKGKANMSVYALAAASIAANKKRTVMTILTMGLSCVLFVILANLMGNMDTEYEARSMVEYGQFQLELSYYLEDEAYPENNLEAVLKNNPLNPSLIRQIQAIDGVREVKTRDVLLAVIDGKKQDIAVLDEKDIAAQKQRDGMFQGSDDFQNDRNQNGFYYGWSSHMEEDGWQMQQSLTAEVTNGTETATVDGRLAGAFGHANAYFIITEETYKRMGFSGASAGWLWVDCAKEDVQRIQAELEKLTDGMEHVELSVYTQQLELADMAVQLMRAGCYLFLVILGMIGFMNLANTMVINIITKKQEYGILQAVGMTNRQLNGSLQLQGLLFSAGTILIAVLAGLPMGYALFCYAKKRGVFGLNVYHIPIAEIVCMMAVIGLLQMLLSFLMNRNLKKESLVDRIRYQD